ncbi:MAG: GGDEF domain-containing protein [Acidimicrobiia bacterium]|nr:GGDEF domain-containing protein [Acidimicrobiia bacterium]
MSTEPPDPNALDEALSERDEEIRRLRLALDVLSPIDPSSGTLNRNGLIDAIQEALNWLARRQDQFGILLIEVEGIPDAAPGDGEDPHWLAKHLEAVMSATLRGVDKIGHLDHMTFLAVLREFKVEGVKALLGRLTAILQLESEHLESETLGAAFTLVAVQSGQDHRAGELLEQVEAMKGRAKQGKPLVVEV